MNDLCDHASKLRNPQEGGGAAAQSCNCRGQMIHFCAEHMTDCVDTVCAGKQEVATGFNFHFYLEVSHYLETGFGQGDIMWG